MRALLVVCSTLLVLCSPFAAAPASAQSRPVADTTAARLVSVGVIRELDDALARLLFDRSPLARDIVVPDTASPAWRAVGTGLYSLLRARPLGPGEGTERYLRIEPPTLRGDTLVAYFTIGGRTRCSGTEWQGGHTGHEVRAVRYGDSWSRPRTQAVLFGHLAPCLLRPSSAPPQPAATLLDRIRSAPRR